MSEGTYFQKTDKGSALLSDCKRYRFRLTRTLGSSVRKCCFIMLNPSTADAMKDDATIRKCMGFARRWECGELVVVNLFAYRATDPKELRRVDDPEGFRNRQWVDREVRKVLWPPADGGIAVAAWGQLGRYKDQDRRMMSLFDGSPRYGQRQRVWPLHALKITKDGDPGHPLYIPYDAPLIPYTGRPKLMENAA